MEVVLETRHSAVNHTAPKNTLYHWAIKALCDKGYSCNVATKAVEEKLQSDNAESVDVIQWVSNKPAYQTAETLKKQKARAFIQQQLTRAVLRILIRKGYAKQAAFQLSTKLINHAGRSGLYDFQAIIKAARLWPECH